jgi:hypothetical protein
LYEKVLFPLLPNGQVEQLLKLNNETADKVKAVATFRGDAQHTKTDMFLNMQKIFKWDVLRNASDPLVEKKRIDTESNVAPDFFSRLVRTAPINVPKRAFICITGQFERLELQNKIKNLFVRVCLIDICILS